MVTRPDCKLADGTVVPGGERVMWNEAYNQAGPACTIQQFEQTTGVRIDHYVVVNFAGFRDMVDAIGGVEVCIPQTVDDREYGIYLEAGTREVTGKEALAYVRERHGIGNGSDIGRMKRQQAFVASMAAKVVSAGTLANPFHLVDFLRAATRSLQLDPGLGNLTRIAKVGKEFKDIGLDKIQFVTVPWQVDPIDPNRVVWAPRSAELWRRIRTDEALTPALLSGRITAAEQPNASPDSEPTGTPSPSDDAEERRKAEAAENGLCA